MKKYFTLIGIGLLVTSCNKQEDKQDNTLQVLTAEALHTSTQIQRNYSFIAQPYRTSELSFRVSGPLQQFNLQGGQYFRKGDVIAYIDPRDFIIRKERAEAVFHQAENDYQRIANLFAKNNISATNYEQAKANYEKAKADFQTAENALKDTRLTAPFDGYIQQVYAERHQDVKASIPVVSMIDITRIKAEAYITEDMAIQLSKGKHAAQPCITFNEKVDSIYTPAETYITQSVTPNNISYLYTAIIDNPSNSLIGGMTGCLSLHYPQDTLSATSVLIPQTAVGYHPEKGSFVWVIQENHAVTLTPVTLGELKKNNQIEVTCGLKPGDKIAASRISQLSENDKVSF